MSKFIRIVKFGDMSVLTPPGSGQALAGGLESINDGGGALSISLPSWITADGFTDGPKLYKITIYALIGYVGVTYNNPKRLFLNTVFAGATLADGTNNNSNLQCVGMISPPSANYDGQQLFVSPPLLALVTSPTVTLTPNITTEDAPDSGAISLDGYVIEIEAVE